MKIIKPSYYKNFKCIAGACPDSCCQGWEVDADSKSLEYYKTLDSKLEIKQRIDRVLDKDEFDNTIFTQAVSILRTPAAHFRDLFMISAAQEKWEYPYPVPQRRK